MADAQISTGRLASRAAVSAISRVPSTRESRTRRFNVAAPALADVLAGEVDDRARRLRAQPVDRTRVDVPIGSRSAPTVSWRTRRTTSWPSRVERGASAVPIRPEEPVIATRIARSIQRETFWNHLLAYVGGSCDGRRGDRRPHLARRAAARRGARRRHHEPQLQGRRGRRAVRAPGRRARHRSCSGSTARSSTRRRWRRPRSASARRS